MKIIHIRAFENFVLIIHIGRCLYTLLSNRIVEYFCVTRALLYFYADLQINAERLSVGAVPRAR